MIYTLRILVDCLHDEFYEEFFISFTKKEHIRDFIDKRETEQLDDFVYDLTSVEEVKEGEYDKNRTFIFENVEDGFTHYINYFKERIDYNCLNEIDRKNFAKKYKMEWTPINVYSEYDYE